MASKITTSILHRVGLYRMLLFLLLFSSLRSHAQALSGTINVGTTGTYTSLTGPTGAFAAINANGLAGNVTFRIISNTSESGSTMLTQWAAAGFTVTIVPSAGTLRTLTYTGVSGDMIILSGADNVTIDGRFGGTGQYLRFASNLANQSVIRTSGDCQNVTIRNCIISSDNASSTITAGGAVRIEDTQTITGSDNLKILYNLFEDYSGTLDLCDGIQIHAPNTAGVILTGLEITGNEFKNINGRGIYTVSKSGAINASQVLRNSFYFTGTAIGSVASVIFSPITLDSGSGHTIRANYIGGTSANCGGTAMIVQLGSGTSDIALIRMKQNLPNSTTNTIDSNVIRNMALYGSTTSIMSVSLIQIEHGNCNVGVITPNFIGDNTVDATWTGTPSILVSERYDVTGNVVNAIYSTSNGSVTINGNRIGGILMPLNTNHGFVAAILSSYLSSANFTNNVNGGVAYNIVKQCPGAIRIIFSDSSPSAFSMIGNSVYGMNASNWFFDTFDIIRTVSGSGAPTITDNTLESMLMNSMTTLTMIRVANPNAVIERNIMRDVVITNQGGTVFNGIQYIPTGGASGINRDNFISNIQATSTAATQASLVGINASGPVSFTFDSNFIERMSSASTNTNTFIRGLYVSTANTNRLQNNVVLLDNMGVTNNIYIYGIYDDATSGSNQIYYNTIDVRGTMSGTRSSACYYRNGAATRTIQNNIFNNRRSGGTGGHYALYHNTTGGLTSNYNVLYTEENAARMVNHGGTNYTAAAWQALGFDANSVVPLTVQNIVDFTNGHQTTTVGNDRALNVGITDDNINIARPFGLGFDMGAFEINSMSLLAPLPVVISSPILSCEDNGKIRIEWTAVGEIQCDYYLVQKSSDGQNWELHTKVSGQGNSFLATQYYAYDYNAHSDGMYYRVIQVDVDGNKTYYSAEFINCTQPVCEDFSVQYDPNGTLEIISVCEMHNPELAVYSCSGQLIGKWSCITETKPIQESVQLMSGVYFIQLNESGKTYVKKIAI